MRPKTLKYVDQEKQGNFSYEHENTLKSMEFFESDEQLCLLTVCASVRVSNPTRQCDWRQRIDDW